MTTPRGAEWIDPPADAEGPVIIRDVRLLSSNRYRLSEYTFDLRRNDGRWQRQKREAYDRGDGAAILLYNKASRTVLLVCQFRLPAYVNGVADGMMLEVPAGLLDGRDPADTIIAEVEEETGYAIGAPLQVLDCFSSPGAVTERLHLFLAEYNAADRPPPTAGVEDEGEDLELVEMDYDAALQAVADGTIRDAKTIILLYYARTSGLM